ncbi:MAG: TonB-dependent receptor [Caulobacteraceae bacterium]
MRLRVRPAVLTLLLCAASVPAIAAAADVRPAAGTEVGEIIVTAQKRAQTVESVPASISALDKQAINQRGVTDVQSLQFATPSLTFDRDLGETQISIRGVGRSVGDPGVAVNIDGVYQPRDTPMIADQADLDRIEVLRGHQGTLYGRNANGGAVNFITTAPTDRFEGYVLGSWAQYDERTLQAVVNVPISTRIRSRLVLDSDVRDQGFVKNIAGGPSLDRERLFAARLRVDADLASNLTLGLNLSFAHGGPVGDYYVLTTPPNAVGLAANPYLANAIVPRKPWETSATGPDSSDRDFASAAATLNWRLPFGTLKSITAFQGMINDWAMDRGGADVLVAGLPTSIIDSPAKEHSTTFSQEFDLNGKTGPVDWVAGLYFFDDRLHQNTFFAFPLGFSPLPPNFYLDFDNPKSDTEAYAGFGDATWRVTRKLSLFGGLRWSDDSEQVVHENTAGVLNPYTPLIDVCPTEVDRLNWDSLTYRAGAQYQFDGRQQVYATVSDGFKNGGVNLSGCQNTYNPETITSYEVGYKGRLFHGHLIFDASAFWYDYRQFQLAQVIGIVAAITNAGTATEKGLELETAWNPNEHWSLYANVALLDARFDNLFNTDSLNPQLGLQNLSGHFLPNAPRISGGLGVAYRTSMADWGRLTFRVDANGRSTVYFQEFNTPEDAQTPYAVVDLNVIWDSPGEKYSVRLFANNVTDQAYWVGMLAVAGLGARAGTWGAPRQAGIEFRAKF